MNCPHRRLGTGSKESARLSESKVGSFAIALGNQNQDLVSLVKVRGRDALPTRITQLPYVKRPKWRTSSQSYKVKVSASLLASRHGGYIRQVSSLDLLQKNRSIRFTASNNIGVPFDNNFRVEWRITNTGQAAYDANALRGDFYRGDTDFSQSEDLSYRGVHFVEAFLINKYDHKLYGQSEPFYVVIE